MTTLQNRMETNEFASIRELVPVFDEMENEMDIAANCVADVERYRPAKSERNGREENGEWIRIARITAIDAYLADFRFATILKTDSVETIRENHRQKLFEQREREEREASEFHQNRRVELLADSEASEFGLMFTEIDYALREERYGQFASFVCDGLGHPDCPDDEVSIMRIAREWKKSVRLAD